MLKEDLESKTVNMEMEEMNLSTCFSEKKDMEKRRWISQRDEKSR